MSDATNTEVVEVAPVDYLNMSDEQILAAGPPDMAETVVLDPANTDDESGADKTDEQTEQEQEQGEKPVLELDGGEGEGGKPEPKPADGEGTKPEVDPKADKPKDIKTEEQTPEVDPAKQDAEKVDFEAEYNRLLTPFKANGRDIAVKSVDDAIALMQMGANYNKKMAALKPNLKLLKMLEQSGFMNEERIGFLIDLGKKDPAAINKLVQESGIDPLDLTAENASKYKPTTRTVDDREIELDTVLDDLKESPTYTRTLGIVGTKWDAASKDQIAKTPELLKIINDHVERGFYDLIEAELENEKMLGRLNGLSDLEAYQRVGDALNSRGAFNHLVQTKPALEAKKPVEVQPKPKTIEDDKLKEKRRAASSTKPAASTVVEKEFNPLSMSDAEFDKLVHKQYL